MPLQSRKSRWFGRAVLTGAVAALAVLTAASAAVAGPDTVSSPLAGPTFNGEIFTVAYDAGTIYVGGDFTTATTAGHTVTRTRLAAIDAASGALLSWAPAADGQVRTLTVANGLVYLGGSFHHVAGAARNGLAAVDSGGSPTSFSHSVNGLPRGMDVLGGRLYVGGQFSTVDGHARAHLAAFDTGTGGLLDGWQPTANATVNSVHAFAGQVFVGGAFSTVNGSGPARLAALDPADGGTLHGFQPTARYEVVGVYADATGVYAAQGGPGGRVVAYTASGTARWTVTTDGNAQAVAVLGDTVYVGGHFANVCRTAATGTKGSCLGGQTDVGKIFALDLNGALQSWRPSVRGIHGIQQIAINPDLHRIAAGGDFTTVGGAARRDFVLFG